MAARKDGDATGGKRCSNRRNRGVALFERDWHGWVALATCLFATGCGLSEPSVASVKADLATRFVDFEKLVALVERDGDELPHSKEMASLISDLGVRRVGTVTEGRYRGMVSLSLYSRGTVVSGVSVSLVHPSGLDEKIVAHHESPNTRVRWFPAAENWWVQVSR